MKINRTKRPNTARQSFKNSSIADRISAVGTLLVETTDDVRLKRKASRKNSGKTLFITTNRKRKNYSGTLRYSIIVPQSGRRAREPHGDPRHRRRPQRTRRGPALAPPSCPRGPVGGSCRVGQHLAGLVEWGSIWRCHIFRWRDSLDGPTSGKFPPICQISVMSGSSSKSRHLTAKQIRISKTLLLRQIGPCDKTLYPFSDFLPPHT